MRCANCGVENEDEARFCVECGCRLSDADQGWGDGWENEHTSTLVIPRDDVPPKNVSAPAGRVRPVVRPSVGGKRLIVAAAVAAAIAIAAVAVFVVPKLTERTNSGTESGYIKANGGTAESSMLRKDDVVGGSVGSSSQEGNATVEETELTVSFDGDGATAGSMGATTCERGESIAVPQCGFARDGYEFDRWAGNDGGSYRPGDTVKVSSDLRLTAVWKAKTFAVQFLGGGANGGNTSDITAKYGEDISLPACGYYRDGYEFDRWESASGTAYLTGDKYKVLGDTSFTAQWIDLNDSVVIDTVSANPYGISANPYGIGGSYEVDQNGLVTNRTFMFKFQIPAGYKGEMLTDNTILFRGKDFTVTIDAWFNNGETQESRYQNASSSLTSIDYETKSEGLFVVSGRDSRGHDMYVKEIVDSGSICRMVVDSEASPCSATCEQATIDFEGGFRLLK